MHYMVNELLKVVFILAWENDTKTMIGIRKIYSKKKRYFFLTILSFQLFQSVTLAVLFIAANKIVSCRLQFIQYDSMNYMQQLWIDYQCLRLCLPLFNGKNMLSANIRLLRLAVINSTAKITLWTSDLKKNKRTNQRKYFILSYRIDR